MCKVYPHKFYMIWSNNHYEFVFKNRELNYTTYSTTIPLCIALLSRKGSSNISVPLYQLHIIDITYGCTNIDCRNMQAPLHSKQYILECHTRCTVETENIGELKNLAFSVVSAVGVIVINSLMGCTFLGLRNVRSLNHVVTFHGEHQ